MQLHRVVAAVQSPVVAQPDERHSATGPQIAESHLDALVIEQDEIGQRIRTVQGHGTTI
jgi:hypothetical protein